MPGSSGPSEEDILRSTLLAPAALPTIISSKDFAALFPAKLRGHAQINVLYRALQHQRALDLDSVNGNIQSEVKRGQRQQRELLRSKVEGAAGGGGLDVHDSNADRGATDAREVSLDEHYPPSSFDLHTLASILPAMDTAIASLQKEVSDLTSVVDHLQAQVEASVGDLSDLRYGKLGRPGLRKDVIESLNALAAHCAAKGADDVDLQQ